MRTFIDFLNESFDTISDFLLNPQHRKKIFSELVKEFEASGGRQIGGGKYSSVFEHPSWPYILKLFKDPYYLRFARYVYKNPHPSLPKLYGPPQRVVPFYRRSVDEATIYIARIEKLTPVKNTAMLRELINNYEVGMAYIMALEQGTANQEWDNRIIPSRLERKNGMTAVVKRKVHEKAIELFQKYPQAKSLYEAMVLVSRNVIGSFDIHSGNSMERGNVLVLVDPVWEGSNQRALNAEIDAWDVDKPENLEGGKLYPPRKRQKKHIPATATDIPF